MEFIARIIFILIVGITTWLIAKRVRFLSRNIKLGLPQDRTDNKDQRWRNMLLVAFGQSKMFKRPIPAILHLFIYVGFIVINIEVLEFIIDGLFGTHRFFADIIGGDGLYTAALNLFEFLAVLILISCVIFLIRRNVLHLQRFKGEEMTTWPKLDANLILIFEIVLMIAILVMNATDTLLQARDPYYTRTGAFFFSGLLVPLFEGMSTGTLVFVERFAWWFHIIGILGFAVYITHSKHQSGQFQQRHHLLALVGFLYQAPAQVGYPAWILPPGLLPAYCASLLLALHRHSKYWGKPEICAGAWNV